MSAVDTPTVKVGMTGKWLNRGPRSPLSDEDGDLRQAGHSPGSDLSLGSSGSSNDNTSGDDGIGDEARRTLEGTRGK